MNTDQYLSRLFGGTTGGLGLGWLPVGGDRLHFSYCPDADALLRRVGSMNGDAAGVYVRMTTLTGPPPPRKRGDASMSLELPALWADIDFGDVGHAHDDSSGLRLPSDAEEALTIIGLSGLPDPTIVVHSGGGLYPLWVLADPWVLSDDETRDAASRLSQRWQRQLAVGAAREGLFYGTGVGDLSRVLRLPGTVNRKAGLERPCRVLTDDGPEWTVDQLFAALDDAELLYAPSDHPTSPNTHDTYSTEERAQFDFADAVDPGVFQRLHAGPGIRGVLLASGWSECDCSRTDCVEHYTRPGEPESPHSAHVLAENPHVLVVHSADAPLPAGAGQRLTAGRVWALLHHDGDESAAARDLLRTEQGDGGALAPYGWGGAASTHLVDDLFDATPVLGHIRDAARSRKLDETAPLLNVLGLRACQIDVERKIPPLIGSRKALNLMLGTVGESASGKTAAHDVALELMGITEADAIRLVRPMGSAQGISEKYMGEVVNDEGRRARGPIPGKAWFFLEDEIDSITSKGEHASDAAFGELRKAYSGSLLGQTNATADRDRAVPGGTYRFVMLANIQPGRSQGLFTDAQIRSGTPQRFVLLPAKLASADTWRRRKAEGDIPAWPGPLDLPPPTDFEGDFDVDDPGILAEVDEVYFDSRDSAEGELMGHRQLTKLKVAAVLADLHGETSITAQWWELAEVVMLISDGQVALCRSRIAEIRAEENRAQGTAMAHQQFEMTQTRDELDDAALDEVRDRVLEHLREGPATRTDLRGRMSTGRRRRLEEALEALEEDGLVVSTTEDTGGRPRKVYVLTEET